MSYRCGGKASVSPGRRSAAGYWQRRWDCLELLSDGFRSKPHYDATEKRQRHHQKGTGGHDIKRRVGYGSKHGMAPDWLKLKTLNDNPYYTYEWTWAYGKILECFGVDPAAMTGFGADGERQDKENDFQHVRGDFDGNPFVKEVLGHIERKTRLGEELLGRLV